MGSIISSPRMVGVSKIYIADIPEEGKEPQWKEVKGVKVTKIEEENESKIIKNT